MPIHTNQQICMITLWEPWASLAALGVKRHETRGRRSKHVGPVIVIAGKAWSSAQADLWDLFAQELILCGCSPLPPAPRLGRAVCVVDQVGCYRTVEHAPVDDLDRQFGDWSPGRFAYRWENPRAFAEPFRYAGTQGMRPAPDDLIAEVLKRASFTELPPAELPLFPSAHLKEPRRA